MTTHRLILAACIGGSLGLLAGCEDPAAKARAEAQQTIETQAAKLAELSYAPIDGNEDLRRQMRDVISALSGVRDVAEGQVAAAALMTSEAQLRVGSIDMAAIEQIEADQRRRRDVVRHRVGAAHRLAAVADAMAGDDAEEYRALLAARREAAQEELSSHSAAMAELDGPIAERMEENDADRSQSERLRAEANDLRRSALEAGHADGLADFTEAVRREREADGFDSRVANREGDLTYDLGPRHALASARVDAIQAMLSDLDSATTSLGERRRILDGDVSATRELVTRLGGSIAAEIRALDEERSSTLSGHYDAARTAFEAAASAAARARGRDDRAAAALAAARAQDALARLHWLRAQSLEDQASLVQAVMDAGGSIAAAGSSSAAMSALQTARTEALRLAAAALTAASEKLSEASTQQNATEIDAFRRHITESLAALGGATESS